MDLENLTGPTGSTVDENQWYIATQHTTVPEDNGPVLIFSVLTRFLPSFSLSTWANTPSPHRPPLPFSYFSRVLYWFRFRNDLLSPVVHLHYKHTHTHTHSLTRKHIYIPRLHDALASATVSVNTIAVTESQTFVTVLLIMKFRRPRSNRATLLIVSLLPFSKRHVCSTATHCRQPSDIMCPLDHWRVKTSVVYCYF